MQKKIFRKSLIFIIIFLFVGASFTTIISGNSKKSIHSSKLFNLSISNKIKFQNSVDIIFDYEDINGMFKPFSEINCGPLPNHNINGVDLTNQYNQVGISFIRTHDFSGPTDISSIFPNWSADPNLESSYDFQASDKYISGIINAGCSVFYRLGESASTDKNLRIPPENFTKWAEICKHIVMHYNNGWNNGYFYNITYFEIWNEPDLDGFWSGTAMDYYNLYQITAETLKTYDSTLKIGGPCTSSLDNYNYTSGFLRYVTDKNVPIDFFSWHQYADTPYQLYLSSRNVRELLNDYDLINCENINTEWNINILTPQRDKDNVKNAAFTSCCLSAFQDAGIDYSFRYRGTQDPSWLMRLIGFDLSLFTYDGIYKNPALSYLTMNYLIKDCSIRLNTTTIDASSRITYLGGKSEDNTNVSILISNFEAGDTNYNLEISSLPWDGSYKAIHYSIDSSNHLEITLEEISSSKTYSINKNLKDSTVHFIRLTNSSTIPEEGPNVAKIPILLRLKILDPFTKILGLLLLIIFFG